MLIAIDQNIPGIEQTFARHGNILPVDGRRLGPAQLRGARALIVRSVTEVNSALLANTAIEFVGSATIGTDHLDIPWLDSQGITWFGAPGCNADAAAQYTLAMILLACERSGLDLAVCHVGIVGYGNVGSRLVQLLKTYGVAKISASDPPLAEKGKTGLSSLQQLARCDVISFHVPYCTTGKYPTRHMINSGFLARLAEGVLLVNTSRGDIAAAPDLLHWLQSSGGSAAMDVFPGEPCIEPALLKACIVATPHVAGHSLDGKLQGTLAIYTEFCRWLNTNPSIPNLVADLPRFTLSRAQASSLSSAVQTACPVERDDLQLRPMALISAGQRQGFFDGLRRNYPERRDFAGWNLPTGLPAKLADKLKSLGFH